MYSEHVGNIWNTKADAIGHGTNCEGVMGSGIAKYIRAQMPDEYFEYYRDQCRALDSKVLAGFHQVYSSEGYPTVVNLFTQVEQGPNAKYNLLASALASLVLDASLFSIIDSIALPRIGCGIGGLEWKHVKPILQGFSRHIDIEVWELPGVEWN